ncbi:MAG: hypothetical protein ACYS7Y_30525 [Planctomycetota bacterium]|jgi:hypothetical protein
MNDDETKFIWQKIMREYLTSQEFYTTRMKKAGISDETLQAKTEGMTDQEASDAAYPVPDGFTPSEVPDDLSGLWETF